MAPEIENALPPQWRLLFQIVTLPVYWIPNVQAKILGFIWDYSSSPEAALKFMLFLLPALHVIVGMWCTMTAVYTLPFRGGRKQFIAVVLSTWWDSGRAIGLYWAGILRAMFLTAGYVWGFIRIFAAGVYLAIVELITLPFSLLKQVTKKSLRPGIPWIAVALTIFWCILEGGAFSFTLFPLFADIVAVYVGAGSLSYLQPILFVFLVLLIAGSFAALDAMVEAIQKRNVPDIVKTVVVEAFVMFFEVLFLYRELVDAITPVLAHQSGGQVRIGLTGVLLISSMAWIGIPHRGASCPGGCSFVDQGNDRPRQAGYWLVPERRDAALGGLRPAAAPGHRGHHQLLYAAVCRAAHVSDAAQNAAHFHGNRRDPQDGAG
jgi:hypothetical protein